MDLYTIRNKLNSGIPLSNINLRVTFYSRVSTDHLEQKKSLNNQVEYFTKYIKENANWIYVPGYIDQGISGTSDIKRDNFMKMIDDARDNKFDLIITKEISRFSRNTLDSIKYTRELLLYGVAVLFLNDNINTALTDSELRLTIMASMAQDEIRRLSERVKFGMRRAIEKGEILGNNLLYGYKKIKNKLVIVEEEAKVVRKIFKLYGIDKYSLCKIVKKLNNDNKKWCVSTISRMIENPKYKGCYCGRKTEIIDYMTKKVKYFLKDDWIIYEDKKRIPPIVDSNLWEKCNNRLNSRKRNYKRNNYLYSKKIYCREHNSFFYRRIFRNNKKDVTWICSEYLNNGLKACSSPNIRESELNIIFKDINDKLNKVYKNTISLLLDHIVVSSINGDRYKIELNIF